MRVEQMSATAVVGLVVAAAALQTDASAPPPEVYWVSTPVQFNETVVVAGGGLNVDSSTVMFCTDAQCTHPVTPHGPDAPSVWNSSVKVSACTC